MEKIYEISKGTLVAEITEKIHVIKISDELAKVMCKTGITMKDICLLAQEKLEEIIFEGEEDELELTKEQAQELSNVIYDDCTEELV